MASSPRVSDPNANSSCMLICSLCAHCFIAFVSSHFLPCPCSLLFHRHSLVLILTIRLHFVDCSSPRCIYASVRHSCTFDAPRNCLTTLVIGVSTCLSPLLVFSPLVFSLLYSLFAAKLSQACMKTRWPGYVFYFVEQQKKYNIKYIHSLNKGGGLRPPWQKSLCGVRPRHLFCGFLC